MHIGCLRPKKFLSLGTYNLPHIGEIKNKPYFITIGCSFGSGMFLKYQDTWSSILANKLNYEHINLSWEGSSLNYQYNTILKAEKLLKNAKFIIWMHTYPNRYHLTALRYVIGDKLARKGLNKNLTFSKKNLNKISKFVFLTKNKKILHTNAWGYDKKTKLAIEKTICRKNKKYLLNTDEYLDRASDGEHAGPKSHKSIADKIYQHIQNNFPDWHR